MPSWDWLRKGLKTVAGGGDDYARARTPDFNPMAGMEPTNDMTLTAPLVDRALPIMPNVGLPQPDERTGAFTPSPTAIARPSAPVGGDFTAPPEMRAVAPDRTQVPVPGLPGTSDAPQPYSPMRAAQYDYVNSRPNSETVHGFGDRLKSGLKPALLGFLQAAAKNPQNPLAAGAGGAIAGFGVGAINPTMGRAYEFDTLERPQMEADVAQERASRAQALDERYRTAQIGELEGRGEDRRVDNELRRQKVTSDTELARMRAEQEQWYPVQGGVVNRKDGTFKPNPYAPKPLEKARAPIRVGNVLVDPVTFEEVYRADSPDKPMSSRDAYDEVLAEDGSIEQIAQDSLQGRLESLKGQLSPGEREIIEGRIPKEALDTEILRAKEHWRELQDQEMRRIRRDTESRAKAKAAGKRKGSSANSATAPRNLSDLTSRYLTPLKSK